MSFYDWIRKFSGADMRDIPGSAYAKYQRSKDSEDVQTNSKIDKLPRRTADPVSEERMFDALEPWFEPFPDPSGVFADPIGLHVKHLDPLVSIDLTGTTLHIPDRLHVVCPKEPCDGYVGDGGQEHWSPWLQPNWLAFHVDSAGRYKLLGDFRFFAIENVDGCEAYPNAKTELIDFYKRIDAEFYDRKNFFEQHGRLHHKNALPFIDQIGGDAPVGNMAWDPIGNHAFTFSEPQEDSDFDYVKGIDGRPFQFIASVDSGHYRGSGPTVLLWFDQTQRIALQSFVWT